MPVFRRQQASVPGARHAERSLASAARDRSVPADQDPLVSMLVELDELRATVYRQAGELREAAAGVVRERAVAEAYAQRRALIAVQAMHDLAAADPDASPEVRAFAARTAAAVARLEL
jgi:hypothetical protein